MKKHQAAIGLTDVWFTPTYITDALGVFDLDPATSYDRPNNIAQVSYTPAEDGLVKPWRGRVWLNPPFNRYARPQWMRRMAEHGNGVMLIPAACETKAFKDFVFSKASGLLMLDHRPKFLDNLGAESKSNCGCTICLVAYGEGNLQKLRTSGLGTVLVEGTI